VLLEDSGGKELREVAATEPAVKVDTSYPYLLTNAVDAMHDTAAMLPVQDVRMPRISQRALCYTADRGSLDQVCRQQEVTVARQAME
jgi:hypothetical protein